MVTEALVTMDALKIFVGNRKEWLSFFIGTLSS